MSPEGHGCEGSDREGAGKEDISCKGKGRHHGDFTAMVRDLVALRVKASTVNAAVGCIAGHLGTVVEGEFTRKSTSRAVIKGGIASTMQIAEEIKAADGVYTSICQVYILQSII